MTLEATAPRRFQRWHFGDAVLDGSALELSVAGEQVALEPKALELLLTLLRHPGEVVTKSELLDAVWPGRVVTESVLTRAVTKVRQALRDQDQSIIRTVHGYGYRLVAGVRVESVPAARAVTSALSLKAGDRVPGRSNWQLLRALGEGGHGEVWLAEQMRTHERRVFKFCRDSAGLSALKREITLFRVLNDTLGDRGDIVPLLDWNLEEAPYFIESSWAREGSLIDFGAAMGGIDQLPLAERFELAARIADALSAAHGVGVLHKDLKPGNILMEWADGRPRPMLSDFGSGHMIDAAQLDALGITRLGYTRTLVEREGIHSGTPLYLAPEVVAGHAPTVRSDIYSLGVMLYQLVIGDFRRPLAPGWEREIGDPLLCEDVAACVDGDPARRLDNAGELARRLRQIDTRREQRRADEDARIEREQLRGSLARSRLRRRWLAALAAVLALCCVVSCVLYLRLRGAQIETLAQARRADGQAAIATAVNDFLVNDLLVNANPYESGRGDLTMQDVLRRAVATIADRFPGQREVEARVRLALAAAFEGLSDYEQAAGQIEATLQSLSQPPAHEGDAWTEARTALAGIRLLQGRHDEARELVGDPESIVIGVASSDAELRRAHVSATIQMRMDRPAEAIALYDAMLPAYIARYGEDSLEVMDVERDRGEALHDEGRLDAALEAYRRVHETVRQRFGDDDLRTTPSLRALAAVEYRLGRHADALPKMEAVVRVLSANLEPRHHRLIEAKGDLGLFYQRLKRYDDAAETLDAALVDAQATLGPAHNGTLIVHGNIAMLFSEMGDYDQALEVAREVRTLRMRTQGEKTIETLTQSHNIASYLQNLGRWHEADTEQRRLLPLAEQVFPAGHWQLGTIRASWGNTLLNLGREAEGRAEVSRGMAILVAALGEDHRFVKKYRDILAAHPVRTGRSVVAATAR